MPWALHVMIICEISPILKWDLTEIVEFSSSSIEVLNLLFHVLCKKKKLKTMQFLVSSS